MARRGGYAFDRRRKEDLRKAKQDAKRQRKTDRQDSGQTGPEMGEPQENPGINEYTWFSASRNRIQVTVEEKSPGGEPDDWTLIGRPEGQGEGTTAGS
jgi:hypothetical protein